MLARVVVGLAAGFLAIVTLGAPAAEQPRVVLRGVVVDTDDRPVAGATVKNLRVNLRGQETRSSQTDEQGRFEVGANESSANWVYAGVLAETEDGRVGFVSVAQQKPEEVRIVVQPARQVTVNVQDANGKPVSGASVEFISFFRVLARGETDEAGQFTFRAPQDTRDWTITAHRSKLGFDYANSGREGRTNASLKPLPDRVELKLDGARTVRFRAIDHAGKPVAGVRIGPWIVQKPNHESEINLSGTTYSWAVTDESGKAALDWLPEQFGEYLAFTHHVEGYYATEHSVSIRADQTNPDELTINLLPLEKLSGRVTLPDGKPAVGAQVMLRGRGTNQNEFHQAAVTDEDGRYSLNVYSEQQYLVMAKQGSLVSPIRSDAVVRIGKPVEGVDLVLGSATTVRGRVTVGSERTPAASITIGCNLNKGEITKDLPRPPNDRYWHGLYMHFNASTDADGNYTLVLGPGEYQLNGPPRTEPVKLTIPEENPPAEIVHDFHMERPETGPFSGQVIANGKPVAGALVQGRYASDHARHFFRETKTDNEGRFQVERALDPLVLHARSADGKLAGVVRSDADTKEERVPLGPATSASGTIKDKEGKILAGKKLQYGIRIYRGEPGRSAFSDSFGGSVISDDQGRFTLEGLVLGEEYELSIQIDDHSSRRVTKLTPKDAKPLDLGELTADPNPTPPYVPPTPAERAAKAFAVKPDVSAEDRVTALLADAKVEYFRPLLLFGTAKDPACVELYRLFQERDAEEGSGEKQPDYAAPNELRWEFDLAALDLDRPGIREYAKRLGVELSDGVPLLVLLDDDGKPSDSLALELKKKKLDPRRLGEWMEKHKLPQRDAVKSLADALAQAKAENKRVFFTFSASWCGPCRMLSRALAPFKPELEKHFVFVKVDVSRDERMDELRARFPQSKSSGVPWFCLLDPQDGEPKLLATSNRPKADPETGNSNIGCPTMPEEVDYFLSMLKLAAPAIDEATLSDCKAALLKK